MIFIKKKICVYTCITGNYDTVHEIEKKESGIDYLLFTNNKKIKSDTWDIIYIEDNTLDNQRLSRKIKILGDSIINENYDISLWMDAAVVFKSSVKEFIKKYYDQKKAPFSAFVHNCRNCIYDEAIACIRARKDTRENIQKSVKFLQQEKYPKNNGLYEMTVFIKEHNNPIVKETMKMWFDMVCNYSKRDQLSFMYCVWKTGMKINPINLSVWNNEYFTWIKHNFEEKINSCRIMFCKDEEYDYKLDIDYNYQIKGNKYIIDLKIPCKTDYINIQLFNTPCVIYKNLKIKNVSNENINIINSIRYNGNDIFYNEIPIIEINNEFMKGDLLHIEIEYHKMTINEIYNFVDYLGVNYKLQLDSIFTLNNRLKDLEKEKNELSDTLNNRINNLERENNELSVTLKSITSSKGWKLLEKLRKIRNRIKKVRK